ncbi:MAG: AAA family ATPase [Candidatus Omnitrophica bacterium]|nr:AAA family ATPase [Candidatus Omnitrophota bacterium]
MARIISVCNQKGGVGKTTTAINLASYIALAGRNVLVVDCDPQANATSGLGIDKKQVKESIYDVLINGMDISQVIVSTKFTNLYIIPSNVHLTGMEVELVNAQSREYHMKQALEHIRPSFDYIILDAPPSLGLLTINALTASKSALIPLQCEYYALEGLSQLLSTINLVRQNLNPALEIEGILLTMADFRTKLTDEVIKEARSYFGEKVYNTVIPRSVKLGEAPGFGMPVVMYDKHSQGARSYYEFAKEFLKTDFPLELNTKQGKEIPDGEESIRQGA